MATKNDSPTKGWTWRDCEAAMQAYADAKADEATLAAAMQDAIQTAQAVYLEPITSAQGDASEQELLIREFARAHKGEFNSDGRSYEYAGVTVGFRKNPDSLQTPRNQDGLVEWLKHRFGFLFVRVSYEPDKETLHRFLARETDEEFENISEPRKVERALEEAGIGIRKGADKFFIEVRNG
jgi:phage host-nuclease inhibitor protein Gam